MNTGIPRIFHTEHAASTATAYPPGRGGGSRLSSVACSLPVRGRAERLRGAVSCAGPALSIFLSTLI